MVQQGPDIVLEVPDDTDVGIEGVLGVLVLYVGLTNFLIRNWVYIVEQYKIYFSFWTRSFL